MKQHPMHDEIHCMTKFTTRQNPLRDEMIYKAHSKFSSALLQTEMEVINENIPFETDPCRC